MAWEAFKTEAILGEILVLTDRKAKEVWTSNFQQYGQMEKQRWEESVRRRAEERRSDKSKSEKKEEAGARKGRKVAKHGVFPMICGSRGSNSK